MVFKENTLSKLSSLNPVISVLHLLPNFASRGARSRTSKPRRKIEINFKNFKLVSILFPAFKGIVNVFSIDPPFIELHVLFTAVS